MVSTKRTGSLKDPQVCTACSIFNFYTLQSHCNTDSYGFYGRPYRLVLIIHNKIVIITLKELFMHKKLTLSLDDSVIERAKRYAKNHNQSLSELVENYFVSITSEIKMEKTPLAPVVEDLLGSIQEPQDFDYNETKRELYP